MDSGSVVSEPISAHHRAFAKQKSASMVSSLDCKKKTYAPISILCKTQHN